MVDPHLLKDAEAVKAFEGAKMGKPVFIRRPDAETADYYLVPFDKVVKKKGLLTSAVIVLDAKDGHFKEASWTDSPECLIPVSAVRALQLLRIDETARFRTEYIKLIKARKYREAGILVQKYSRFISNLFRAKVDLVWQKNGLSPSVYKPYWRIDTPNGIRYVTQEGKVFTLKG